MYIHVSRAWAMKNVMRHPKLRGGKQRSDCYGAGLHGTILWSS